MPNVIENLVLNIINTYDQYFSKYDIASNQTRKNLNRKEVILLGQGWFAKGFIENINHDKYSVCNISRTSFINTPMLLSTIQESSGTMTQSSSQQSIQHIDRFRRLIDKEILQEGIENIDLKSQEVITDKARYSFSGKYLVCGVGSHIDNGLHWQNVIKEIQSLPSFKAQDGASGSSRNILNKPICIIGAGLTGTELAFYLADKKYNIALYDGLPLQNLYEYLSPDGKQHVLDRMKTSKIDLVTNQLFDRSTSSNYEMVIFATGSRPNGLTAQWKVTPRLQLQDHPNIFAGGDGIISNFPRNAQVAYEQGKYVARLLNGEIDEDFTFHSKGVAMYCGENQYYTEVYVGNNIGKTKLLNDLNPGSIPNLLLYGNNTIQDSKPGDEPSNYFVKILVNVPSHLMTFYYNIFK